MKWETAELERKMVFAIPIRIDGDSRNCHGIGEEGTGHPRDFILGKRHIELAFKKHVISSAIGCHLKVDGTLGIMQEGIEVK